mmetsp:Transcript_38950/g.71008  ORF Transcript_38950/g.71008 Transcript_38950/m.71008 type:complete len:420 (-) Transcript_38950:223-1482(-)
MERFISICVAWFACCECLLCIALTPNLVRRENSTEIIEKRKSTTRLKSASEWAKLAADYTGKPVAEVVRTPSLTYQEMLINRSVTIHASSLLEVDAGRSMMQKRGGRLRLASASELAKLAAYYTGKPGAELVRPPGPTDQEVLMEYSFPRQLPSAHVSSLLQVRPLSYGWVSDSDSDADASPVSAPTTTMVDVIAKPTRFLLDGVLNESACRRLREMFDRHKPEVTATYDEEIDSFGHVIPRANERPDFLASTLSEFISDEDFPLLLALRQRMIENVKHHLDPEASSEFTHFILRTGHEANTGMGTHADNCNWRNDRHVCVKTSACCAWRSHTAFTYLSDEGNVDGGEFYFARHTHAALDKDSPDPEDRDLTVRPKCGQMVGFSSGFENPHGVLPLRSGSRYSVGLWLTKEKAHVREDG